MLALIRHLLSLGALMLMMEATGPTSLLLMMSIILVAYAIPMADAVVLAKRHGKDYRLKAYNRWYVYLLVLVAVAGIEEVVQPVIRAYVAQAYHIPSSGMAPTLRIGDHIMTDKRVYEARLPERFEVVVFEFPVDPKKLLVQRVIGLPGETVEVRDKRVFINGAELADFYGYFSEGKDDSPTRAQDSFGPLKIPDHSYFVLGDNRNHSYDSRFWGTVDRDKIYGRVRLIYFSWDSENSAVRWDRIGKVVG